MPDVLHIASLSLVEWLLTFGLHSTLLLGAVALAHRAGWMRRPETQDMVWKVALLAGIVTATGSTLPSAPSNEFRAEVSVKRTVVSDMDDVAVPWVAANGEAAEAGLPMHATRSWLGSGPGARIIRLEADEGTPISAGLHAPGAEMLAATPECRRALAGLRPGDPAGVARLEESCALSPPFRWYHGLVGLWLVGALAGLIRLGRDARSLRGIRAGLRHATPRARRLMREIAAPTGLVPRVRCSDEVEAPCVIDGRTIVLPERCGRELADDELAAVLAHEMAHVSRRDVAWLFVARVVSAVLWIQPLHRLATRRIVDAAELIADDWALDRTGHRLGLARSISRVAEWAAPGWEPEGAVAMARGEGRSLSARVRRILSSGEDREAASRWRRWAAATALVVPILFLPSVPGPAPTRTAVVVEMRDAERSLEGGGDVRSLESEMHVRVRSVRLP